MTSYNSFFGFVHSLKINSNNMISGQSAHADNPYPAIIADPDIRQTMRNWNLADTGITVMSIIGGTIFAYFSFKRNAIDSPMSRRGNFMSAVTFCFLFSWTLGARNSANRLTGLVPNGLKKR